MRRLHAPWVWLALLAGGTARAQETQPAPAAPARVLTLDDALATARARQPQLRQARAQVTQAQARVDEARAPLLPQVSGSASYERATANSSGRLGLTGATASTKSFNRFDFGVGARQLLWDFGQTARRRDAAEATAAAQAQTARATELDVARSVRAAYFAARGAKALVTVARDTLANQQSHLKQIQGFVEVGTRPQIDLAQARTDVANARVSLIQAENGYAVARAQLAQTMGLDGPADFDVADEAFPLVEGEDAPAEDLIAEATRARPDIAALDRQIHAQELTVRALRGAYGPTLSLQVGATEGGEQLDNMAWNWSAGVSLSWPIFQGGLTRAQVRAGEAALTGLQAQRDALAQQVRLDVEQARLSVRASREALAATAEAVTNARERLRLAEGRYQTGVGNAIELGDAQVALTTALAGQVQADYGLAAARAQLLRALGRM